MTEDTTLLSRLEAVERKARRARLLAIGACAGLVATWTIGAGAALSQSSTVALSSSPDTLRARVLVIEDEQGRDRIVLGAPMPDGRRVVGMKILNQDGAEQFGLTLKHDGAMSMGFDAAPGVGDDRNRERLNLGVSADGRGWIRYLDNRTRARMYLHLDEDEEPRLRFLDWSADNSVITTRLIGFEGDSIDVRRR